MAGGDSPRQKMINMMYIVLIAMLALNVDTKVLKKFIMINDSFESTNSEKVIDNSRKVESIKSAVEDSGNRDEDLFENPDKFDVTRKNARRHVAFGQGIHVCLGMNLSRKEMYTAFPIILDRLKNMRFAEKNDFNYSSNVLLRGLDSLNIEFDKA